MNINVIFLDIEGFITYFNLAEEDDIALVKIFVKRQATGCICVDGGFQCSVRPTTAAQWGFKK